MNWTMIIFTFIGIILFVWVLVAAIKSVNNNPKLKKGNKKLTDKQLIRMAREQHV